MAVKRSIIIRAILALSAAGSILAGSAVSVTAAQAASTNVVAVGSMQPNTHYFG